MNIEAWDDKIVKQIKEYSKVYIYGAGEWARRLYIWFERNHILVSGIIVSNKSTNPETVFDCIVYSRNELLIESGALVIVAVKGEAADEIYNLLSKSVSNIWIMLKLPTMVEGNNYYAELKLEECRYAIQFSFKQEGHFLDLDNPVTFNEKIQWLKVNGDLQCMAKLADKYLVKQFVEEKLGSSYLVKLLGVWDNANEINFDKLPNKFVLKCNHGCGYNIIVKDKYKINIDEIKQKLNYWMKEDYGHKGAFEIHYSLIKHKIIAEEYIEQMDGGLYDYKVHCFNGIPRFIQLIGDRDIERHDGRQVVLDTGWNIQEWTFGDYPRYEKKIESPECLKELIEVAKILSKDIIYVRVDLYIIDGQIKVGEMTFTPAGGYYKYNSDWTPRVNYMLGKFINLPLKD